MTEIEAWLPKAFLLRQGTTQDEVVKRLRTVNAAFRAALEAMDAAALYRSVQAGKWSPAEIADHLIRADALFAGAVEAVCRGHSPHVMPRGRMTDDGRAISPDEEAPTANRPRAELLAELETGCERLVGAVMDADRKGRLEPVCLVHAFLGPLNPLECLRLSAWHVRHHHRQLPVPAP